MYSHRSITLRTAGLRAWSSSSRLQRLSNWDALIYVVVESLRLGLAEITAWSDASTWSMQSATESNLELLEAAWAVHPHSKTKQPVTRRNALDIGSPLVARMRLSQTQIPNPYGTTRGQKAPFYTFPAKARDVPYGFGTASVTTGGIISRRGVGDLKCDQAQVAVGGDLSPASYSDMVQRTLTFEPGVRTFNSSPLLFEAPVACKSGLAAFLCQHMDRGGGDVDNGVGIVLASYQMEHGSGRIALVRNNEARVKTRDLSTSFSQHIGCSLRIINIPCAYIGGNRHFRLAVYQEVQLPTVGIFFGTLRTLLDRPAGVWISLRLLSPIAPSFQGRAVQRHALTESRQFGIVPPHKATRHVLESRQDLGTGKPLEKAAERSLVGDVQDGLNAYRSCDVGVPVEHAEELSGRGETQVVFDDEAMPQHPGRVALRASALGSDQRFYDRRIIEFPKKRLQFADKQRFCDSFEYGRLKRQGCMSLCSPIGSNLARAGRWALGFNGRGRRDSNPRDRVGLPVLQTGAINHSATPPPKTLLHAPLCVLNGRELKGTSGYLCKTDGARQYGPNNCERLLDTKMQTSISEIVEYILGLDQIFLRATPLSLLTPPHTYRRFGYQSRALRRPYFIKCGTNLVNRPNGAGFRSRDDVPLALEQRTKRLYRLLLLLQIATVHPYFTNQLQAKIVGRLVAIINPGRHHSPHVTPHVAHPRIVSVLAVLACSTTTHFWATHKS